MSEQVLISLTIVILFGVGAQWLAWRFGLPSILLLLLAGIIAGPVTGLVATDALFGELLLPFVSMSVALILFEGGLSLKLVELRKIGSVVRNLISIGALVTWVLATTAAYYLLEFDFSLALLIGAILTVTGPTVIGPLLRHVRPSGPTGSILNWEGILIDPVGAVLTLLVFDAIVLGDISEATTHAAVSFLLVLVIGSLIGLLGAGAIVILLRRYLVPDYLQTAITLVIVITTFTLSNLLQHESGLLAVIVMGVALANQKWVVVSHIIEFKENLRVILLALLFVLLGARLRVEDLEFITTGSILFLLALMFVVRPLSVAASTIGSTLSWKERIFLSWMAPRGIVAAAIGSIFALRLAEIGHEGAERLAPTIFLVIIGTVAVYGLTAIPVAKLLGLRLPDPQGVLLVGAHRWGRALAQALQEQGVQVLLADTNWENVAAARLEGLTAYFGSALSEEVASEIDLGGIGQLMAITSNDAVNSLACLQFAHQFGRSSVFQLSPRLRGGSTLEAIAHHRRGRILFGEGMTFAEIEERFDRGAKIVVRTQEIAAAAATESNAADTAGDVPLALLDQGKLVPVTVGAPSVRPGQRVIVLTGVDPYPAFSTRMSTEEG